jgi:hypothetical protein
MSEAQGLDLSICICLYCFLRLSIVRLVLEDAKHSEHLQVLLA